MYLILVSFQEIEKTYNLRLVKTRGRKNLAPFRSASYKKLIKIRNVYCVVKIGVEKKTKSVNMEIC